MCNFSCPLSELIATAKTSSTGDKKNLLSSQKPSNMSETKHNALKFRFSSTTTIVITSRELTAGS